jgi:hypothetical protein
MTETTIYRPISDSDSESETHATTELPIASWSDFKKEIEEAHDVSRDELTVEQATESAVRRREESPTPENARSRPIVKHVSSDTGAQSLQEATDNLRLSRGVAKREALLEAGYNESEVQQLGIEEVEARLRGDPLDPPPIEVKIPDKFGEEGKALSVEEASRRLTEWRQQQAAAREAELLELDAERQQRQEDEAAQTQQAQQPAPEQPQPAQPTPEQTELAQERQRITQLKALDGHEAAARMEYDQTVRAVLQEFPGLAQAQPTPEHIEELRQKDPARYARLVQADQALRVRQQRIAAMAQQRSQREAQEAQITAQQRAAARAQQDADFERRAERIVGPAWQQNKSEVHAAARKTLEAAGLTPQQISNLWHGNDVVDMHSAVLQEVLLKASLWDQAKAKAHQIRQTPMPQVLRPGVGRSHGQDGAERVASLKAALKTSKGNASLRLATELRAAKRALNN